MRSPIPILTYHQIDHTPERGTPFRGLVVSPARFAWHMRLLKLLGYQALSMRELEPYLLGERQGKVVGITFDDGYVNNLTHALPVLQDHGFSSTCYIVSGLVGGSNVWDHAAGVPSKPLMNLNQLRLWQDGGQEIGAHSRHHVNLTEITPQAAQDEIAGSKQDLEQLLQTEVRHFCYPYGEFDDTHTALVQTAGYVSATTTARSRVLAHDSLHTLPRVPALRTTGLPLLWMKLATRYEDRRR